MMFPDIYHKVYLQLIIMENKEEYIKCSHYNCTKSFTKEYYSSGLILPPVKD